MLELGVGAQDAAYRLPAAVLGDRWAVFGRTGSGKTNTAGVMVEQALGMDQQVIVLTPVDAWWGLKFDRDGKKKSRFDVLLAGDPRKDHTDLALTEDMAESLADLLATRRWSAVLTLGHLSNNAQRRFVAAFASRLYFRKQEPGMNSSVTVVLEEAHAFIPQRAEGGDLAMLGALEKLCREGRFCGIGLGLIDQRPASVNKNVLNMVEVMIIHQITAPLDKKAVRGWLVEHDQDEEDLATAGEVIRSLQGLGTGEAWVWSPVLLNDLARVQVNLRETFDSSKTPEPGSEGDRPSVGGNAARFEIGTHEDLLAMLGEVAAQAAAVDPAKLKGELETLRRKVAELEKSLASERARAGQLEGEVAKAEVRAREDEGRRWRSLVMARESWWGQAVKRIQTHLAERVALAAISVEAPPIELGPGNSRVPDALAEAVRVKDAERSEPMSRVLKAEELRGGEPVANRSGEAVEAMSAALRKAGKSGLGRAELQKRAKVRGGTYERAMQSLRGSGVVEVVPDGRRARYVWKGGKGD